MPQRSAVGVNQAALSGASVNGLPLAVAPAVPERRCCLAPRQPALPRFSLGRQRHAYDLAMEPLLRMMVDCGKKRLQAK